MYVALLCIERRQPWAPGRRHNAPAHDGNEPRYRTPPTLDGTAPANDRSSPNLATPRSFPPGPIVLCYCTTPPQCSKLSQNIRNNCSFVTALVIFLPKTRKLISVWIPPGLRTTAPKSLPLGSLVMNNWAFHH